MMRRKGITSGANAALTPSLRFPEFKDASGWEALPLDEVGEFVGDRVSVSELDRKNYVSTENLLPDFGGFSAPISFPASGSAVRYQEKDVLAANIRPYLKKIWLADRTGGASNDVLVIRPKPKVDHLFLSHALKSDRFVSYVMGGAKGLKMPRGDATLIRSYPVLVPALVEQEKVAACLSTLDELIGAETQKLDALKTHKQGLMQRLFPREGEGVPYLRFPEFRACPVWTMKLGGELFANRKEAGEGGLPIYSVTTHEGMVPRASFDRDFYDIEDPAGNRKVCKGDIAYNMMRMWQGAQGVAPEDCLVSPAYVVLAPQEGVCAEFFAYYFKLPQTLELLTATSRGLTKDRLRLYFDDFARMRMCVPEFAEQQRIAACLASLDELIAPQSKKREALETFKRYLMQQLFPAIDQA